MSNEIIAIRHGESTYTGIKPDLTENGLAQIRETAHQLEEMLKSFDSVIFISSPTPRAMGSAETFLQELGLVEAAVRVCRAVRTVDIYDEEKFLQYMAQNSTAIYGDLWLKSDDLRLDTEFCEGRQSINQRALRFLYHYAQALERLAEKNQKNIALVTFTHFEVAVNFLQGLYSSSPELTLSEDIPAVGNGETIRIEIIDAKSMVFNFQARGILQKAQFNPNLGKFTPLQYEEK